MIGLVVDKLKQLDVLDNTYIFFSSGEDAPWRILEFNAMTLVVALVFCFTKIIHININWIGVLFWALRPRLQTWRVAGWMQQAAPI